MILIRCPCCLGYNLQKTTDEGYLQCLSCGKLLKITEPSDWNILIPHILEMSEADVQKIFNQHWKHDLIKKNAQESAALFKIKDNLPDPNY